MNILGMVFALILILSYGFFASWDKQTSSIQLRKSCVGHQRANRTILNKYQSEIYQHLPAVKNKAKPSNKERSKKETQKKKEKAISPNLECSRLNLWPLIEEGKEKHPFLYDLTAKIIRTLYAPLLEGKRTEYDFLDSLLASAKEMIQSQQPFALEKLNVRDFQRPYYKMLKGTKQEKKNAPPGYPSILDYIKAEPSPSKICLFHAHPNLVRVLFNPTVGEKLYQEMHKKKAPPLTKEFVQQICNEMHFFSLDSELLDFLELAHRGEKGQKKIFVAEDTESAVTLRKNFYLKG